MGIFSQFCAHYDANQLCDETDLSLPHEQLHDLDGTPFPGNIIPTDRIDPRATAILQFYPAPIQGNVNDFQQFNHTRNFPNPTLSDQFDIRIDHTINSKQNMFGAGRTRTKDRSTSSNQSWVSLLKPISKHDNQIVLAHNYAITPNLVNELRGGISRRQGGGDFPIDGPAFMQQLGFNAQQLGPFPPEASPISYLNPGATSTPLFTPGRIRNAPKTSRSMRT